MSLKAISHLPFITECSDMLSRFSGITMCSITTGVIWISEPESLMEVLLYDNLHVFLWVGGLYFALRGNRA
jgi:putative oxidoreductase